VLGGSSPYEYSTDGSFWIPFISGNVIDQLPPNGIYNIVVRQDTLNVNCRVEVPVEINGPGPIILEVPIYSIQAASCNQNDGAVKIGRVSGGTVPYNYQIDGSNVALPADSIIANLGAGMHTFSVIDAVGCTENFPFEVDSPGVIIASITDVPVSCSTLFLKAGIRVEVDLDSTTLPGPYEVYIASTSDLDNGTIYQIPDNGLRTILNLDKDFYSVVITSGAIEGCTYSETISVFSGASPVDFDIIDSDSVVSCIGDYGSITIGNVVGDPDTTYIVQLISESNVILETYELSKFELEGGFTINESNTDQLFAGKYYIKMIQNQSDCAGVEAISELITIYEPLGDLGLEIFEEEDEVSLADRPTGSIFGEVIPSGGTPYEAIIQLLEPEFEMNVTDIIRFNENRMWEDVSSTGDNLNLFPVQFDSLWAGLYEMRVRDDYGCEFIIEHSVGYDSTIFVPNVFTPNNDGYNDTFYIRNLPESGTQLVISNRNGFVVYRSDDYNVDNLWDGGTLSDGIYYYNIATPNGQIYKGWIEKWSGSRP
jgi:gliding motility-associated-like protein